MHGTKSGTWRGLEPGRGLDGDLGDANIMMGWKMRVRRTKGRRMRLEPRGGQGCGGGHVHGAGEAECPGREAEKGQREEWHCVTLTMEGLKKEKVVVGCLSKGHRQSGGIRQGFHMWNPLVGGGKEKHF